MPRYSKLVGHARMNKHQRYRARHPEKVREQNQRAYKKRKAEGKELTKRMMRYGMSPEVFDAVFAAQGQHCAICFSPDPKSSRGWCVDHDHTTKSKHYRAILCFPCNVMLGMANDDILILQSAIQYLIRHLPNANRDQS